MSNADYDETPYPSYCYPRTSPEHLAAVGTLFGMTPPAAAGARVVEFGSGMGGNLLPLAARFPQGHFVGIDYSPVQIAAARADSAALGLTNVTFDDRSILDVGDAEYGPFDYVIAHGFYSWVPDPVRERMMALIERWLSPNGIAFVSYNARPAWDAIRSVRDAMLYRTRDIAAPREKAETARRFLNFMAAHAESEESLFRKMVEKEAAHIARCDDAFLLHDYLEETNEAFHIVDVAEHGKRHGLQYLGDSVFHAMPLAPVSPEREALLRRVGAYDDIVKHEQYSDFLSNRRFRMTLFCRAGIPLQHTVRPSALKKLRFVTECRPPKPIAAQAFGQVKHLPLIRRGAAVGAVAGRALCASVLAIIQAGETGLAFAEVVARAAALLGNVPAATVETQFLDAAAKLLEMRILDIRLAPPDYAAVTSDRTAAFAPARLAAARGETVPNMRHEVVRLTPRQREILVALDGRRDLAELRTAQTVPGEFDGILRELAAAALIPAASAVARP